MGYWIWILGGYLVECLAAHAYDHLAKARGNSPALRLEREENGEAEKMVSNENANA